MAVQVGVIIQDAVLVANAAREGARTAAVDPDPAAPGRAAAVSSGLPPDALRVEVSGRDGPGSFVTVAVHYRSPVLVPLLGAITGGIPLSARTTMRVER